EAVFSPFGKVASVRLVTDSSWRRSKGFGFVDMPNDAEAAKAIKGLHRKDYGGRPLLVAEARPRDSAAKVPSAPATDSANLSLRGLPPPRLSPSFLHDRVPGVAFEFGEKVSIQETKVGPRPPALWLGKTGRIVDDRGQQEANVRAGDRRQQYHAVQLDGFDQVEMMPQSWLRKMNRAGKRRPMPSGLPPENRRRHRPFTPRSG
ncbi:MAG: RNA-binding protein, partial [Chloroflexi bacterium]|nr:RNA-binding protein [Chloroflexota bacterium]